MNNNRPSSASNVLLYPFKLIKLNDTKDETSANDTTTPAKINSYYKIRLSVYSLTDRQLYTKSPDAYVECKQDESSLSIQAGQSMRMRCKRNFFLRLQSPVYFVQWPFQQQIQTVPIRVQRKRPSTVSLSRHPYC